MLGVSPFFFPLFLTWLRVLLQCPVDVDSTDIDSWTPLHAAAHWGQEEVCTLLADNMCDMGAVNNVVSSRQTTLPWHQACDRNLYLCHD